MWVPKQGWTLAAINLGQVYCKSIASLCTLLFIVLTGTVTSQQGGSRDVWGAAPRVCVWPDLKSPC